MGMRVSMRRTVGAVLAIFLVACTPTAPGNEIVGVTGGGECDSPTLAASSSDVPVATTCAVGVMYQGEFFAVHCLFVHPTRIGPVFVTTGGDTAYDGARRIRGVDEEDAFVLIGPGDTPDMTCRLPLAVRSIPKEALYHLIRQPLGTTISIESNLLHPGETGVVRFEAPQRYVFGPHARLFRFENGGVRVRAALLQVERDALLTRSPNRWDVAGAGFSGARTWEWRVPNLRKGAYELQIPLWNRETPRGSPHTSAAVTFKIGR